MKTGKELKIDSFKKYNVVYGSVNHKNPKAIYINISSWAEPKNSDDINYSRSIKELHKKIKQSVYNHFDDSNLIDFNKERTIVDLDIRESGIKFGKRSFMSCELTLFLENEIPISSDIMKPYINDILYNIIELSFETNKFFNFHKKKK